jgi:hypothetical protein
MMQQSGKDVKKKPAISDYFQIGSSEIQAEPIGLLRGELLLS